MLQYFQENNELRENSINALNQPQNLNNRVIREKANNKNRKRKAKRKGKKSKKGKSRKVKKGKSRSFRKGKKTTSRKSSSKRRSSKKRKLASTKKSIGRGLVPSGRKVLKGSHCEYIDLCEIDRMAESGCNSGQKFVIKVI